MSTFTFRGHEVYYRREGTGPSMVFLHNGGTSHRTWEPLIERYAADHDVVAPDMIGFGRSGRPNIDYSLDLYVEMLGAMRSPLQSTPFSPSVPGHPSQPHEVALNCVGKHPAGC
jgi:pimeloyl-ACP methyl ester carboxylesterase